MHNHPTFANHLIDWYKQNKRDLPWRLTKDPYKIWLSEIILQQTRVAQGLAYYNRFVKKFPTVEDLANAPIDDVLRLWQGLGYYSRARNLHSASQEILEKYNLEFPNSYKQLLHLKGVGHYTAAAIASFAFNEEVAVLDGNVFRVLSRFYGISSDISSTSGIKEFREISAQNLPHNDASTYNQAIMEFGALQCAPKSPNCTECPLLTDCYAYNHELQAELPVKIKKVKIRHRYLFYFVIRVNDNIYMKKREKKDIWEGLYDFHLFEGDKDDNYETAFQKDTIINRFHTNNSIQTVAHSAEIVKHVLSHQNLYINFSEIRLNETVDLSEYELYKYTIDAIEELPKPIVLNNYLEAYIF